MFCYFGAKQNTYLHFKIVNGGGNFVRYAVAESATDAAERGQRVLAHFAEPQGGKAYKAGLTDAAERGQRVLAHFAEPQGGKACKAGLKTKDTAKR